MGLIPILLALSSVVALWTAPAFGAADPVINAPLTAKVALEASSAMIPAYTVTDADGDTLTYSLADTTDVEVDSVTGLVTTKSLLNDADIDTYVLIVSDGSGASVTGTITYTAFTDTAGPAIAGTLAASVSESAAVGTDVVASGDVTTVFVVTDADKGDGVGTDIGDGITYELSGSTAFTIDLWSGVVTTAETLDYATTASYSLTVTVKDSKRTPATAALEITVTEDKPPACSDETKNKTMFNGAAVDTEVYTMNCPDPEDATVTYTLNAGNTDSDFKAVGAIIKVANELNYTRTKSYVLEAEAADQTSHTSTVTIYIDISQSSGGAKTTTVPIYIVAGLLLFFKCL